MRKYWSLLSLFVFIGACSQPQSNFSATATPQRGVTESRLPPQARQLQQRFERLQRGYSDVIRITQFGDSHSAADFMTGRLRTVLQRRYGDAGIGWIAPLSIRGQRHDSIAYQSSGWDLFDSRKNNDYWDYPMGGYVAKAESETAIVHLNLRKPQGGRWLLKLLVKGENSVNGWKISNHTTSLPTEIKSTGVGMEIGGIWLTKIPAKGVIVETVAANGAQNTLWDKWQSAWLRRDLEEISRSDMVILSYGTNEAFNDTLNIQQFQRNITHRIQQIRQALPQSVILIIGASESYQRGVNTAKTEVMTTATPTISAPQKPKQNSFSDDNYPTTLAGVAAMKAKQRAQQQSQNATPTLASNNCESQRPRQLSRIQQVLAGVAKQQGTLYWDWQAAMGGACQVPRLITEGLMQKDGIHFTRKGYQQSADNLLDYLQSIGLIHL